MCWIDYTGAVDKWYPGLIGTNVTGTFTRQSVGDNLYEYSVIVHAKNALAWCVTTVDWTTLIFGAHADEVYDGADPALGESIFKARWLQDADSPIADINLANNHCAEWGADGCTGGWPERPEGWQLLSNDIRATANGPLHVEAGLGPEGTPGKMIISQTGRFDQSFGHGNGNADGFPAEVADLYVVGR
jgi:hypothetical protein